MYKINTDMAPRVAKITSVTFHCVTYLIQCCIKWYTFIRFICIIYVTYLYYYYYTVNCIYIHLFNTFLYIKQGFVCVYIHSIINFVMLYNLVYTCIYTGVFGLISHIIFVP